MNFGQATPPSPDEGQWQLRVLDLDRQIQSSTEHFTPFSSIVSIDYDLNDCLQHARENPTKRFIMAIIARNYTPPQIQELIENQLMALPNICTLHLFFTNGAQFYRQWRTLYPPIVITCRSITANLRRDLKTICVELCELNIEFCEDRAQKYAQENERGIANDFQRQKLKYIELTLDYKRHQLSEST